MLQSCWAKAQRYIQDLGGATWKQGYSWVACESWPEES